MIRIKNVGIGYYDSTRLDSRGNQGPRSRWVTGEIYVDAGLEDALNVDRDSFNRFHPEFRAVQSFIHDMLKTEIFPDVYRKMEARSEQRRETKEKTRKDHLESVVSQALESTVHVRVETKKEASEESPRAMVTETAGRVVVTLPPAESHRTRKPQRKSATAIIGIFEIAVL